MQLKLQKILVKARRQVFSEMVGNNASVFQGEGYDFIELREYMPGDDIRHIDWNITAKMRRPYIKVFKEERELNVVLATMLNGSVYFGSKKMKQDLIAEIVALLGFSVLKNGDLLSYYNFADKLYTHTKPTKKISAVKQMVEKVLSFDPLNKTASYSELSKKLYQRLKRCSLIIIIGDFFEIPDFKVLAKKHEVILVVVRDRYEENPPHMGHTTLVDPETAATLEGNFNALTLKAYRENVLEHDHKLYERLRKDQIRFMKLYTDDIPSVVLRRLFEASL